MWMTQDTINPRVAHLCFVHVSTCSFVLENVVIVCRNEFSIQTVRYSLLSYFWYLTTVSITFRGWPTCFFELFPVYNMECFPMKVKN